MQLQHADFRYLDGGRIGSDPLNLVSGMIDRLPLYMNASHVVQHEGGLSLAFFKSPGAQVVFVFSVDKGLRSDALAYTRAQMKEIKRYRVTLAKLGIDDPGVVPVGQISIEEQFNKMDSVAAPIQWFTPHAKLHPSIKGKGVAGVLYSRFLLHGNVGFMTSTHTPEASKLWSSVARHLGTRVIYRDNAGGGAVSYSFDDGPASGTRKILLAPKPYASLIERARAKNTRL